MIITGLKANNIRYCHTYLLTLAFIGTVACFPQNNYDELFWHMLF